MKFYKRLLSTFCCLMLAAVFGNVIGQQLAVAPDSLYMGQIPAGSKNKRFIKVFNLSITNLEISSFTIDNDAESSFTLLNDPSPVSLRIAGSVVLEIEFSPSSEDLKEAHLVITSNNPSSPDRFLLKGFGLENDPPTFERVFGDLENDGMSSGRETSDGGYILGGSTLIPDEEWPDMYIVKTDEFGEIIWETTHGDEDSENTAKVLETSDGYIAFGQTNSKGEGKFDFYLVKFNSSGDVVWEKTYGGISDDLSSDMVETSDGGYFLYGSTRSFGDNLNSDAYLVKVNSSGDFLWDKRFGGSSGDSGDKIIATQDGNYVLLASTASFGAGGFDIWLIKVDESGNELWNKTYGGSLDEEGNGITETPDADLVIIGNTFSFGSGATDIYRIKTNSTGTELWNKVDGGQFQDDGTNIVSETDGLVYTISERPLLDSTLAFLVKSDFDGTELWRERYFGGAGDLQLGSNGHIIISGSTGRYGNNTEVYFLNVNGRGQITNIADWVSRTPSTFALMNNYPNPFNNQTRIMFQLTESQHVDLSVYNTIGQKVSTLVNNEYPAGVHTVGFNSTGLSTGVYFYKLKTETGMLVKKMMLLK